MATIATSAEVVHAAVDVDRGAESTEAWKQHQEQHLSSRRAGRRADATWQRFARATRSSATLIDISASANITAATVAIARVASGSPRHRGGRAIVRA
jgi:hypothetical protein